MLSQLVEQLDRAQDEVARMIAEAVRAEVREYEALADPDAFAEVIADTRRHLQVFVRCAPTHRMPDVDELEFISALARDRAAAGFPLEAMLHAFRVGHRVLWDWLIARVDGARKGDMALTITPFMHEYLGAVTRQLTEMYVEEVQTLVADADKNRRDLLEALLRGEATRVRPVAQAQGLDPDAPCVVLVATLQAAEPGRVNELLRRADSVIRRRLLDMGVQAFSILRDDELVMLVPWGTDRRRVLRTAIEPAVTAIAQMYGARLGAGASTVCDGLAEIGRCHQEARLALRRALATGDFVALVDASLYESLLALGATSLQRRLPPWAAELHPDRGSGQNELLQTLLAYLAANTSVERAAQALFVHPNTVRYRLRRLEKLTGLDIASFYDLVELVTAVRLLPAEPSHPDRGGL